MEPKLLCCHPFTVNHSALEEKPQLSDAEFRRFAICIGGIDGTAFQQPSLSVLHFPHGSGRHRQ